MFEYGDLLLPIIKLKRNIDDILALDDSDLDDFEISELKAAIDLLEGTPASLLAFENKIRRNVESRLEKIENEALTALKGE